MLNLLIQTDETIVAGNVTYPPGASVPVHLAIAAGVVTAEEVAALALDAHSDIEPDKASVPGRKTRARTPKHREG